LLVAEIAGAGAGAGIAINAEQSPYNSTSASAVPHPSSLIAIDYNWA
jgi:hypothetical protein